ncbi:MAG TPA: GtrA family protein [Marmoricola sp.]|jgi:putative flippase GtrA|nr:GtrA family protein [Marmoricola sp.]
MAELITPASLTGRIRTAWSRREVRFLVVGGLNTLLALVLFSGARLILGSGLPYLLLLVPTYGIGVPVAFTSQRLLVFDAPGGNAWVDFARYSMVQLTSVGLNALLLAGLVELLSVPVLVAQVVTLAVIVVVTYFGHLLFSFRRPSSD